MGPHDQPSRTTISSACLREWGTSSFEESFLVEMKERDHDLPLDEMCGGRGYRPLESWVEFEDLKFTKTTPLSVEGSFHVTFEGAMNGGCPDNPGKFNVSGPLFFQLNLRSGQVVFDTPQDYGDYGHESD